MQLKFIVYILIFLAAAVTFIGGEWAGTINALILLGLLVKVDKLMVAVTRLTDEIDYTRRTSSQTTPNMPPDAPATARRPDTNLALDPMMVDTSDNEMPR